MPFKNVSIDCLMFWSTLCDIDYYCDGDSKTVCPCTGNDHADANCITHHLM